MNILSNGKKKLTISDIAKLAGVSNTTISRYLNGKYSSMSQETRERIETVINLSDYQPNAFARSLKSKRSRLIGVILANMESPFSSALTSGCCEILDKESYIPIIVNCANSYQKEKQYLANLISHGIEGLLVNTSSYDNPYLIELACKGFPIVLLDRYVKDYNFDIVTSQCSQPINQLLIHLKNQGFDVPVLFSEDLSVSSTRQLRFEAFTRGLNSIYNVTGDPAKFLRIINTQDSHKTASVITQLYEEKSKDRVPAVIGINSFTTAHLVSTLKYLNISSPYGIGVAGPDDWSWNNSVSWADNFHPGITTWTIPSKNIGREAARILVNKIKNSEREKEHIEFPCELVIRGSTKLLNLNLTDKTTRKNS